MQEQKQKHSFFRNLEANKRMYKVDAYFEISSKSQSRIEFENLLINILNNIYKLKQNDVENELILLKGSIEKSVKFRTNSEICVQRNKRNCCG